MVIKEFDILEVNKENRNGRNYTTPIVQDWLNSPLLKPDEKASILKCCLLEYEFEQQDQVMTVPWGTDLNMIEKALRQLSRGVVYV